MSEYITDSSPPPPSEVPPTASAGCADFEAAAQEVCERAPAPVETPAQVEQGAAAWAGGWNDLPPEQIQASLGSRLFGDQEPSVQEGMKATAPETVSHDANAGDSTRVWTAEESNAWATNFENEMRAKVMGTGLVGTSLDASLPNTLDALKIAETEMSERHERNEGEEYVHDLQEEQYTEQIQLPYEPPSHHQPQDAQIDPVSALLLQSALIGGRLHDLYAQKRHSSQTEAGTAGLADVSTDNAVVPTSETPKDTPPPTANSSRDVP